MRERERLRELVLRLLAVVVAKKLTFYSLPSRGIARLAFEWVQLDGDALARACAISRAADQPAGSTRTATKVTLALVGAGGRLFGIEAL